MRNFIVINGTKAHIIKKESLNEAVHYANNYMDVSKEIIVRQLDNISDQTKEYIKSDKGNR